MWQVEVSFILRYWTKGKPFYEDGAWLKVDPIPWSRTVAKNPEGNNRESLDNLWHNWNIEYANDLFSLLANIHQDSDRFVRMFGEKVKKRIKTHFLN